MSAHKDCAAARYFALCEAIEAMKEGDHDATNLETLITMRDEAQAETQRVMGWRVAA